MIYVILFVIEICWIPYLNIIILHFWSMLLNMV